MAIWLGDGGGIRLNRLQTEPVYTTIRPSDVDPGARRFSLEKHATDFITGDRVWVQRVDADGNVAPDLLSFVSGAGWADGRQYNDGEFYANVDPVGGIRLYRDWESAIEGAVNQAIPLNNIVSPYRLRLSVRAGEDRCIAQTVSWELNTNREVADITPLGQGFAKNMSVMVSGSGQLECFFDAGFRLCDTDVTEEPALYLHRLAMRQEIGSGFTGVFLLKQGGSIPVGARELRDRELFYTCDCLITSVAMTVEPGEVLRSRIQFVTTGQIQLLFDFVTDYLLQEQAPYDKVLQESDFGVLLEVLE